ncbi:hypothetical protein [Blastococcus atacamensis]|uniref:hypothetical protein n=1 Tax=Blastococcus atacamensis TaxID=2070508 RepID=UPI000CEBCA3E|nr:hypothetical protein [Blastococcus atacamensis]
MDYLSTGQVITLLKRLVQLTEQGALDWESAQKSQYRFVATTGKFGFLIKSRDEDDFNPYILEIHAREGSDLPYKKLQEVSTADTDGWFGELEPLYSMVKRRVLNIDEIANDLFSELDHLGQERGRN